MDITDEKYINLEVERDILIIKLERQEKVNKELTEQLRLHCVGFTLPRPLEAWNEAQKLDVADYIDWHLEKEKSGN